MTKVSRWKVEPDKLNNFSDDFWSAITLLEDKKQVASFLREFLTPTERVMFAKRFQVILMLISGSDYQTIKNRIHVTDMTIAKMANLISERGETIIQVARKIMSLKEKKWFVEELGIKPFHIKGDLVTPFAKIASNKVGMALARRKKSSSVSVKAR